MSNVSVSVFRTYGPGASFADVSNDVIQWYIDATEATFSSYLGSRGYADTIVGAQLDYQLAVFKVVTWDLLVGVRGVSQTDPAHAAAKMARDEAIGWVRDVASGKANLATGVNPPRARTMTASVIFCADDSEDGTRGW